MRDALLVSIALFFGACGRPLEPAATPPARTQGGSELTGAVDEDAFMALHALREDEAPPARGERIEIEGRGAYLSLPEGDGPFPVVIVIHEWWGLNSHIQHWADRLAADGYAALAVDLYGGQVATESEGAMALMRAVDEAEATAALQAAAAFLGTHSRVDATKMASIGWCFGGGWSLRAALSIEGLDAAVMYYGHPITDPAQLATLRAPLLAIFGKEDESIPPATVDEFEAALSTAGANFETLRYDAPHAFANPSSARYAHDAAADAWEHVRAFFAQHLR